MIDAVPTIVSWTTLHRIFKTWEGLLGSVDLGGVVLRTGANSDDPFTSFCARCIVAVIISRCAQAYDGHCFNLATQFLTSDMKVRKYSWYHRPLLLISIKVWVGVSSTLRGCLEHSHSALLANLIFVTRIILRFHSEHSRDKFFDVSSQTLSELSPNIDARLASSEMQHEFVVSGMNLSMRHRSRRRRRIKALTHQRSPQISSDISGRSTSRYMKAQTRHCSSLSMRMMPSSHLVDHRILCAPFKITATCLPRLHISPPISQIHLPHLRAFQPHWIPFIRMSLAQQKMPRKPPMSHRRA